MSYVVATLALALGCALWSLLQRAPNQPGDAPCPDTETECGDCTLWGNGCSVDGASFGRPERRDTV